MAVKTIQKAMRVARYELLSHQTVAIKDFLAGNLSTRELGQKLGTTHQSAINIVAGVCRQWTIAGDLKFTNGYIPEQTR